MTRIVVARRAARIAARYRPVFIQGFEDLRDLIVPIPKDLTGPYRPTAVPEVYYSVKEDDECYYIIYAVYHRKDWSDKFGGVIRNELDSHEHDFEGVLLRVAKRGSGRIDRVVVAVCHKDLEVTQNYPWYALDLKNFAHVWLAIEPQGHGIGWYTDDYKSNCIQYRDYKLVNMNSSRFRWEELRKVFNPKVNLPDQWDDWKIAKWVKRTHPVIKGKRITSSAGLIYTAPDVLIELMKRRGRIK